MTQPRVPSCGRHLGKFDDVTIYPVLVVARTVRERKFPPILIECILFSFALKYYLSNIVTQLYIDKNTPSYLIKYLH